MSGVDDGYPWWLCPNTPRCGHGAALHDVEEFTGDGTETCCVEGCDCRGPNAATVSPPHPQPPACGANEEKLK